MIFARMVFAAFVVCFCCAQGDLMYPEEEYEVQAFLQSVVHVVKDVLHDVTQWNGLVQPDSPAFKHSRQSQSMLHSAGFDSFSSRSCVPFTSIVVANMVVISMVAACIACKLLSLPVPPRVDSDSPVSADRFIVLDNAKFFLMVMVIWTHLIANGSYAADHGLGLARALWFHIPLFCIISGMLSKKPFSLESLMRLIQLVIVPLVLYTLILSPLLVGLLAPVENIRQQIVTMLQNPIVFLFSEIYPVWYIRCLVLWRVEAWTLDVFPPLVQIAIVFSLGIFASYLGVGFDDHMYQQPLMKCATMGPFFFTGRILGDHILSWLEASSSKNRVLEMMCGWGALIAWLMCAFAVPAFANEDWLVEFGYPFRSYRGLLAPSCQADVLFLWSRYLADVMFRGLMALFVLVFCMPRQRTVFTCCGSLTIYPFLLHMHALGTASNGQLFGFLKRADAFAANNILVLLPFQFFLSVFLTWFLTSPPFRFAFGWALQPTWLPLSSATAKQGT